MRANMLLNNRHTPANAVSVDGLILYVCADTTHVTRKFKTHKHMKSMKTIKTVENT
jgi:ribosome-binding protein aMBF1 (putative translation factor)